MQRRGRGAAIWRAAWLCGRGARRGGCAGLGVPGAPLLLMAGWVPLLPPALLLSLLCARPCLCGTSPASSSQPVTARLAAKWPATPLLLEARCVQPPPLLSPSPPASRRPVPAVSWGTGGRRDSPLFPPLSGKEGWQRGLAVFLCGGGCVKVLSGCEAELLSPVGKCYGRSWQGYPTL